MPLQKKQQKSQPEAAARAVYWIFRFPNRATMVVTIMISIEQKPISQNTLPPLFRRLVIFRTEARMETTPKTVIRPISVLVRCVRIAF